MTQGAVFGWVRSGRRAAPGEVSLAHHGVLFLDELPEFARPVLDSLRQPLESGEAVVARANAHVRYPSRVQMVAAMNPCRCGHLADPALACSKAPGCGLDYQGRISGPLLDRIDIQIETPAVAPADLARAPLGEGSASVAARVAEARARAARRLARHGVEDGTNASAEGVLLDAIATPDPEARSLLDRAAEKLRLTARGYHRVLRVARTIADLDAAETIGRPHIAEAIGYRRAPLAR